MDDRAGVESVRGREAEAEAREQTATLCRLEARPEAQGLTRQRDALEDRPPAQRDTARGE